MQEFGQSREEFEKSDIIRMVKMVRVIALLLVRVKCVCVDGGVM